jgi:hypothetical protein
VPFRDRHLQRLGIFLKIVIDHGERNASLQICEVQARPLLGRIFVAVGHRASRRTRISDENRVELAQQSFDHAALMDPATIAIANLDAIVIAAAFSETGRDNMELSLALIPWNFLYPLPVIDWT